MKIEQSMREIITLVLTEEEKIQLYNELCDAVLDMPVEKFSLLRQIRMGLGI